MKKELLKDIKDIKEVMAENIVDEKDLANVSGGATKISTEADRYKVSYITRPDYIDLIVADPSTGYEVGELLQIEKLNKIFTVKYVAFTGAQKLVILSPGENDQKTFTTNVRRVYNY